MRLHRYGNVCFLFAAYLMLQSSSSAYGETPVQASTVAELIALFDSASCKECHETIYEQWEKSHHGRSLIGMDDSMLLISYIKRVSKLDKLAEQKIKADLPCFKCHLPQIKHGTDAVAGEIAKAMLKMTKPR